jgi:glycine cleavage system H protein
MDQLVEYSDGELWFSRSGDTITVGITEVGLRELGTLLDLALPEESETFEEGDDMGAVHGRDGELRLICPLAFKILERNHEVLANPTFLEDDPTGDGWILRGEAE